MNKTRVLTVVAALAVTLMLYAVLGFFVVPALLKQRLVAHVEHQLKHKLDLGEVRFNPFTFALEARDLNLQEANGGVLLAFKRLYVNFEAVSVFQRAWDFAEITLEAPVIYGELRADGSNNFTALLAALSDPAKPDAPPPPLKVQWIRVTEGRIDLADLQAGKSARLRIAPITLELTAMSTLKGEKGPYKLTARTSDGETLTWDGDISLYPIASTAKLVLTDWKLSTFARLLGTRISMEEPAGKISATLEYVAGYADGKPSLDVRDLDLRLANVSVAPKGSATPLAAVDQIALTNMTFALKERAVSIQRVEVTKGQLGLEIDAEGRPNWAALLPPPATAASEPPIGQVPGEPASKDGDPASQQPPWRIDLKELALGELALKFVDRRAGTEVGYQRAAVSLAATAEAGASGSALTINGFNATIEVAAIDMKGDRIAAERIELATPSVKASFGGTGAVELGLETPSTAISGLTMRHASAATKKDTLALRAVELGAKSASLNLGSEAPDAVVDALTASITGAIAREPAQAAEILQLERAQMEGGALNLRERRITMERLLLANATVAATIDAGGKLDWEAFVAAFTGGDQQPKVQPAPAAAPAWKALVKNLEVQNLASSYSDQRQKPPLTLGIVNLNARASNVGTDPSAASKLTLTGRIKDGGELKADGRINPHTLETDLTIKIGDLTLAPLQPILAEHARLQIVSALGSAEGRLRYGQRKSAGAQLLFEGSLGLNKILIEETDPRQPFLVADALRGNQVRFSLDPGRLDIPDLRMEGFSGKLVIAEDQSVNLGKVLRPKLISDKPPSQPAQAASASATEDKFPVSIARIRVDRSRLEFADLSLRPQFATRMHELKGVVTGVSSAINSRAQVELEARVDEFGSGRIRGEINIFKPSAFTEIDMTFRNLDMTSLAPYTIKFAGYRIAAGTLSMDLKYRIKDNALVGENKLVLDKFELGERVESPTAFNIPLDLAIAILKDSDGRIDIGLPVSGSLDDPQFSYSQLIWKAIGNLFTRIITAPFRALASLFGGGGSDKPEAIEFDPGRDSLMPPEKQKLRTVAEALAKRPQLKLIVKPAYAEKVDRPALQSIAVRREIALRSGIKLAPGEDPGPVDYANPRTQRVIENLFIDLNSSAAARDLQAEQQKKAKATATDGGTKPAPGADAPAELARTMTQKLVDAHSVTENDLAALAKRRGDVIAAELNEASKIDPARLETATPGATDSGTERSVNTALELTVIK